MTRSKRTDRREPAAPSRVLVVGGGIAGLACARRLAAAGVAVRVLDKGRGLGGRVSTRRMQGLAFDHGAQYFTARDPRFRALVEDWRRQRIVEPWRGRLGTLDNGVAGGTRGETERYVGRPGMSAVGRNLAAGLESRTSVRVECLEPQDGGVWAAFDADGSEHRAEIVVLAMPAPQALALMTAGVVFRERVAAVEMSPCWAVLVAFPRPLPLALDGAFVAGSALTWVARNSSKPGRPAPESWVLHAGPEWSARHLEADRGEICEKLLAELSMAAGTRLPEAETAVAHRWLYAQTPKPLGQDCAYDPDRRLGVCGDWCPGARVEGAFLSGEALAAEILRSTIAAAAI